MFEDWAGSGSGGSGGSAAYCWQCLCYWQASIYLTQFAVLLYSIALCSSIDSGLDIAATASAVVGALQRTIGQQQNSGFTQLKQRSRVFSQWISIKQSKN